jgi:hypothetical protein
LGGGQGGARGGKLLAQDACGGGAGRRVSWRGRFRARAPSSSSQASQQRRAGGGAPSSSPRSRLRRRPCCVPIAWCAASPSQGPRAGAAHLAATPAIVSSYIGMGRVPYEYRSLYKL